MAFLLTKDRPENTDEELQIQYQAYSDYLRKIKEFLPVSVYEFALATWHYDDGSQGLHDSWVESICVIENSSSENIQHRDIEIQVHLLSAYHNRKIELVYQEVQFYSLTMTSALPSFSTTKTGHGDWLYDEIRLSERGLVLHEVEFSSNGHWLIECKDIKYSSNS